MSFHGIQKQFINQFILLVIIGVISTQVSAAQEVSGTVKDDAGDPLPGVSVFIESHMSGTVTDSLGEYRLKHLPEGRITVKFSLLGYQHRRETVQLDDGETETLNVSLQKKVFESAEITVTGTPFAISPLKTPSDVDVLTGSSKLREQESSLGASLEQMGGISNISTGSQIGKPVVRGLSGQRIRVLQNGVTMDYQQFGVRHGPNIDPFSAERIEVVRGASSVQYGSDALGGAINIIPNHIPEAIDREPFVAGKLLTEYATNNGEKVGGLHFDGAHGGWGWTATVVGRSAGNMHVPDVPTFQETDDPTAPKFSGEIDYTDYEQLNGNAGIGYTFDGGKATVDYIRWGNEQNLLLPSGEGMGQRLTNDHLHLSGRLKLNDHLDLEPDLAYQRNVRRSNEPGSPRSEMPDEGPAHLDLLLENYTAQIDLLHGDIGPFSGRAGLEAQQQHQVTRGVESLVPSADQLNVAGFIYERAEYNNWVFNAGFRLDRRIQEVKPNEELNLPDTDAGETDEVLDRVFTELSGSLGAIYQFTDHLSASTNIGRGFRSPSVFELHAEGIHGGVAAYQIGNPYLDPERSLTTDFSLRWRSDRVNAKATLYRNKIDNYIMMVNTGEFRDGTPVLRNQQATAVLVGGDVSVGTRLTSWLELEGVFETVQGNNVDNNISSVDELPLLPASNLDVAARMKKDELGFLESPYVRLKMSHTFSKEAAGRYEPFWQFGNAPQFSDFGVASTDAYTLFDLQAGFDFPVRGQSASFILNAKNILNTDYRSFLDTYKGYALSPGRNISFRLVVPFNVL